MFEQLQEHVLDDILGDFGRETEGPDTAPGQAGAHSSKRRSTSSCVEAVDSAPYPTRLAGRDTPGGSTFTVTVVGATPLVDVTIPVEEIAAPVQTLTGRDIDNSGALDVASYLSLRLNGVHVNETQSNPFQPDVNYRGYTASPLLGTPQGLSVYMDGVRLNQPFGDVVSWDLIPRMAIFSGALMPGSNPLFGLNTLGGALSIQTKDGRNSPGTTLQAMYGSDSRRYLEFEHGGRRLANGVDWYVAGNLFAEDGWRDDSPSDVRQLFGKLGVEEESRRRLGHARLRRQLELNGNGLQEIGFLDRDYAASTRSRTKPTIAPRC